MRDYFIFDGLDSRRYDAYVFDVDAHNAPAKQVNTATVPGRSGDLLLPGWRFGNVAQSYDVIILKNFERNYTELRNFLLSREGYCRLEDSIHPDEFYTAYFASDIQPEYRTRKGYGKFRLTFTRKPQRWLKSGEREIVLREGGSAVASTVTNPTRFACYPEFHFKGNAMSSGCAVQWQFSYPLEPGYNLGLQTKVTFKSYSGTGYAKLNNGTDVTLDMETLQCYASGDYFNSAIQYTTNERFPFQLGVGNNAFTFTNAARITRLALKPRWYIL